MIIKDKQILPIIQGGMGVGVSLGGLAGAVANQGAIGTISSVGIGYRERDFDKNSLEADKRSLKKELDRARDLAQGRGLIAVNVMMAITAYEDMVREASALGADLIIVGAGLPLNLPELVSRDTLIAPIVSGARALRLLVRRWQAYDRLPDLVVLEGAQAGGHLGFKDQAIRDFNEEDFIKEISEIRTYLDQIALDKPIALFVAGNTLDEAKIKKYMEAGAQGFQMGTPFIATHECDAHQIFKDVIVGAKEEDVVIIKSPVGMPARAIRTPFVEALTGELIRVKKCRNCLQPCSPAATEFCISDALIKAAWGNYEEGLFFAGQGVEKINKIRSVKELIDEISLYILRAGSPGSVYGQGSL